MGKEGKVRLSANRPLLSRRGDFRNAPAELGQNRVTVSAGRDGRAHGVDGTRLFASVAEAGSGHRQLLAPHAAVCRPRDEVGVVSGFVKAQDGRHAGVGLLEQRAPLVARPGLKKLLPQQLCLCLLYTSPSPRD